MTWADVAARGSGRVNARVSIAGLDVEFVTHRSMAKAGDAATDYRDRVVGLDVRSIRFGFSADLMLCSLGGDGCSLRIADIGGRATQSLARRPSARTFLASDSAYNGTSIVTTDASAFASSGVLHVGTECIAYTSITGGTTFTGLTRAYRGTVAQSHYAANGAGIAPPHVTDKTPSLEGRRVAIYFYADGDDMQGNGTLAWRGVVASGPRYSGGAWTIPCDPLTRALQKTMTSDANADGVPIRGVYYGKYTPFCLAVHNLSAATAPFIRVAVTGFFETQAEFCEAVDAEIQSKIAALGAAWTWGTNSSLRCSSGGDGEIRLTYATATSGTVARLSVHRVHFTLHRAPLGEGRVWGLPTDGVTSEPIQFASPSSDALIDPTASYYAGSMIYEARISAPMPRASIGHSVLMADPTALAVTDSSAPANRIYLGGAYVPASSDYVTIGDDLFAGGTSASDVAQRYIELTRTPHGAMHLDQSTLIKLGQRYATGTLNSLVTAIASDSKIYANAVNPMPLLTLADIVPSNDIDDIAATSPSVAARVFVAGDDTKLSEMIEQECRALGVVPYYDAAGGYISFKRVAAIVATDAPDWTIGDGDILRGTWATHERSSLGNLSTIIYKTGFDPASGDHAMEFTINNLSSRGGRSLEVAQLSKRADDFTGAMSQHDIESLVFPRFALFGGDYEAFTLDVGLRYFYAQIGDVVSLTCSKIPNVATGALGVTDALCRIVGHSFDASTGHTTLVLMHNSDGFSGYAPGYEIDGRTNISGNTWELESSTWATYGAGLSTVFAVGDSVTIEQYDTTTITTLVGTVSTLVSDSAIRVTFAAPFVPVGGYFLRASGAAGQLQSGSLARYAYVASSAGRITWSGGTTSNARIFA